MYTDLHLV